MARRPVLSDRTVIEVLREVSRPRLVLGSTRQRNLTERQREVLDHLDLLFDGGFATLTMATLAKRVNCSLRTLYVLASSRDELVLMVVDRRLHLTGRAARAALSDEMTPLEALRSYLQSVTVSLMGTSDEFAL